MLRPLRFVCLLAFTLALPFAAAADPATVTFSLDFPKSQPEHYSIRVPTEGPAHYESSGRISSDSDETDSFEFDFSLSSETRNKIFDLAARAGYFQKDVDSRHKGIAFTGKKVLAYKDAERSGEAAYNYSTQPAVQELTTLMQDLSSTLEFGHRLRYDLQYQKLALDDELKKIESMAHNNSLIELAAIRPVLERIVADPSVINVTRARAQRLLTQPPSR